MGGRIAYLCAYYTWADPQTLNTALALFVCAHKCIILLTVELV